MKYIVLLMLVCVGKPLVGQYPKDFQDSDTKNRDTVSLMDEDVNKLFITSDSTMHLIADMNYDHHIFGYETPDTTSKKLILFSIFTNQVKGNPYDCPLGSYYQTAGMKNMKLIYVRDQGNFIESQAMRDLAKTTLYFEKRFVEFRK